MTALFIILTIFAVFTAISLACAVRISRPCPPAADPFLHPFGDMPGFSDAQLHAMCRQTEASIARDPLRRSFATGHRYRLNYLTSNMPRIDDDGAGRRWLDLSPNPAGLPPKVGAGSDGFLSGSNPATARILQWRSRRA
jgi:hypothetical protein